MHMLKEPHMSKRCITPFKGIIYVFEHVLTEGFDSTISISKSLLQIHWLPTRLHSFLVYV